MLWKSPVTLIKFELSWLAVELVGGLLWPNPPVWQPNLFLSDSSIVMIGVSEMRPIDTLFWWDETDDCLSVLFSSLFDRGLNQCVSPLKDVNGLFESVRCLSATGTFWEYGTRLCPMFFCMCVIFGKNIEHNINLSWKVKWELNSLINYF